VAACAGTGRRQLGVAAVSQPAVIKHFSASATGRLGRIHFLPLGQTASRFKACIKRGIWRVVLRTSVVRGTRRMTDASFRHLHGAGSGTLQGVLRGLVMRRRGSN